MRKPVQTSLPSLKTAGLRRSALSLAILGGLGALIACGPAPQRPNLLLITVDTLRADHLGCYGYDRPTSPVLDALAAEGALFERSYVPVPTTAPSHASLMTARYPSEFGAVKNGAPLRNEAETLAEVLTGSGYATGAVVSSMVLAGRFGWAQGFQTYDSNFEASTSTLTHLNVPGFEPGQGIDQRADVTTDKALAWLRDHATPKDPAPFFLWVHYFDPHAPYLPPPSYAELFPPLESTTLSGQVAAYDAEIRYTDTEIGRLLADLEARNLKDDTVIVVVGDHGEGLNQHGFMGHGLQLYEEAVRVPLLMRHPARIKAGGRIIAPVTNLDIKPTILDLLGPAVAARVDRRELQGQSLAPRLGPSADGDKGTEQLAPQVIFLQRRPHKQAQRAGFEVRGDKSAVIVGNWKYIEAVDEGTAELYDLESDPGEQRNLIGPGAPGLTDPQQDRLVRDLRRSLREWGHRIDVETDVRVEEAEALKALGYVE